MLALAVCACVHIAHAHPKSHRGAFTPKNEDTNEQARRRYLKGGWKWSEQRSDVNSIGER